MNERLWAWAKLFLRLAIVLLGVGVIPLLLTQFIFTSVDPLVPVMLV